MLQMLSLGVGSSSEDEPSLFNQARRLVGESFVLLVPHFLHKKKEEGGYRSTIC